MQGIEFHEIANIFPLVEGKDFAELKEDIRKNGLHEPIVIYDEKILDGRNRFRACQEIGLDPEFVDYDGTDPTGYVISLNLHRRHLNESQRAMVAAKLATLKSGDNQYGPANLPGLSNQEAGEKLNVSERSVRTAKKVQKNGTESLMDAVTQGEIAVSTAATVASLPEQEQEEIVKEVKEGAKPAEVLKAHVSRNSGNNEWYTPPQFIEAAREVMGSIDLDPASCEVANKTVKADKYYTAETDGLSQEWAGNVWMNPPYSQPEIRLFIEKLIEEAHKINQAIVLVNNATETKWFQLLASNANSICFVNGRIKYLDKDGVPASTPLQGQAIIYCGPNSDEFKKVFSSIGFVASLQ